MKMASTVVVGMVAVLVSACGRAEDPVTKAASTAPVAGEQAGRKKIEKQLAECAGCQASSKKAQERAAAAEDKIGSAQCETCKGYWGANGNDKNGGLHFSKKCQQCVRMEAAGRDGACDACNKTHEAKKKEKRDKN